MSGFDRDLGRILDTTREPRVIDRIWDYREGRITRRQLLRDPNFALALSARYDDVLAEVRRRGIDPTALGHRVMAGEPDREESHRGPGVLR